jgi:predicted nucleic acid-binding protein
MTMTRRLRSQQRSEQRLRQTHRAGTAGSVADVLVDTDVFIDHLRGAAQLRPGRNRLHYSVITRAELFAGNTATALASQLLAPFREVAVDRAIAERAGRVARESGLRLPDALIAATALENGLQLSTRNVSDFDKVRGLRVKPPR